MCGQQRAEVSLESKHFKKRAWVDMSADKLLRDRGRGGAYFIRPHIRHVPPLIPRVVNNIIQLETLALGDFFPWRQDRLGGQAVFLGVDGGVRAYGEGFTGYGPGPWAPDVYHCPAAGV